MNAPLGYVVAPPRVLVAREHAPAATPGEDPSTITDWSDVHHRLLALGQRRAALEHELGRWLLAAERLHVAARCGMASLYEYAARHLDLSRRQTEERLRVAKALAELPALEQALARGQLHFSHVRELSRVATADTEEVWIDWAQGRRAREIEQTVATLEPGAAPTDAGDPARSTHRLSFEISAETFAMIADLRAAIAEDLGHDVDDDTLLLEMARRALSPAADDAEGRAPYQIAVNRCDACQRASVDAGGQRHPVSDAFAERAACDAQHIGRVDRPHVRAKATQTIPPATRRQVLRRDGKRCAVPGCHNHRFLDLHHTVPRSDGGTHDPDRLITLCGAHHRAVHHGTLVVEGSASGWSFRHADGTPYGARQLDPRAADLARQTFSALVHLGFKHREARLRVERARGHGAPADLDTFLRDALRDP